VIRFTRAIAFLVAGAATACSRQASLPSNWVTVPDRVSHDAFFPIAAGAHGAASCNDCHGAFDTFKMFDCLTCHDQSPNLALHQASLDAAHTGLSGYVYTSAACYQCHPRGIGGAPANHTPNFFPIGAGTKHAAVGCTECHLDLSTPNDPTKFRCYTCHSALPTGWPHPDPVGGVAILTIHTSRNASTPVDITSPAGPANCLKCHADSQVDTVASHPTGQDGDPSHNSEHAGAGCLTCHSTTRTDKTFGTDFTAKVAQPCFSSAPPGCVVCHPGPPPCNN
jgi:hypothetical protein